MYSAPYKVSLYLTVYLLAFDSDDREGNVAPNHKSTPFLFNWLLDISKSIIVIISYLWINYNFSLFFYLKICSL